LQLEKEIAINTQPGLWGFSFDLLVHGKNKIATSEEESYIIETLEHRMGDVMPFDSWATECAVRLLSNYYKKKQLYSEVERVINCLEKSFELTENNPPSFQKARYLETLYQLYTEFGFIEKAENILIRLRELNKADDGYLKTISSEGGISRANLDDYVNRILKGDPKAILTRIAIAHTPNTQKEEEDLEKSCRENPFAYLCTTTLIDEQGRKTAILAPINMDREGHLIAHTSKTLRVETILLHCLFEEAIRRDILIPKK
jgi:tetratricopeptide (TPR) repeat protein